MQSKGITLAELIARATEYLCTLNYAKGTVSHYLTTWNLLKKYASSRGVSTFTLELGIQFLSDYYDIDPNAKLPHFHVPLIRRIKVLEEFKNTSEFRLCHQKDLKKVPIQFEKILKSYQKLCHDRHLTQKTIQSKSIIVTNFLIYLNKKGIGSFCELSTTNIYGYVRSLEGYSSLTKSGILFTLRDFLKFLYVKDLIAKEVSNVFPVIVSNKFERIASFYSKTEINKLLGCVDQQTKIGKRDYTVLILAIHLRIRAGDIRKLKFGNIKWDTDQIEYIQEKTKNPICLPLTENIKFALLDYLKNSRSKSTYPNIFVKHRAPFIPFSKGNPFYEIINKYINKANIKTAGKKHGLHSMRYSLASNLLSENTPIPVISGVLGHKSSDSTNLYLRIDIESLRSVALKVPDER
jgi:site-specific recombinase XerD